MQQYLVDYMFDATIWGVTIIGDEEWLMEVMRSDAKGDGDFKGRVPKKKPLNLWSWS